MKKIRLLIIPSDPYGVGHYRSIWPGQEIQANHSEDFDVDIRLQQPVTDEDVGKFDIVHFHRRIGSAEQTPSFQKKFRESGAVVVSDIDDYWVPFHGHPARQMALNAGLPQQILSANKGADYITTTTDIFKRIIEEKVKNVPVHVIPNAVNMKMKMWTPKEIESDRVRIAWIGGSSHEKDLARLSGTVHKLLSDNEIRDKIQIVMCGYDTRGTVTEIHPKTKEEKTRPIRPEESIWNKFEQIFNANGMAQGDEYVRRNTLPITQYGTHYNHCDICLAPLDQHTFNECKSELKIIETGIMGKALIASDVYIYNELLTHGENAMLIDPKKDHKLWFKYIKELVLNEELRNNLGKNLYNLVHPCYTMEEVTKDRCNWYKEIVKK